MDQTNSVYIPGLTRRGPVYNSRYAFGQYLNGQTPQVMSPAMLGALPSLPPVAKYGAMAALLFLGMKNKLPFGMVGGAAAAAAVFFLFPDSTSSAAINAPANTAALTPAEIASTNQAMADAASVGLQF